MPWQPIQIQTINPYANLADSLLTGMQQGESAKQAKLARADHQAAQADALKREQEAQFRAAYDDVVKGYHEGKYTEDEARSKLSQFGAVFAQPGGPAQPQQPPAPQLNPLSRAVAAQSMGQQAIAPSASAAIPSGPGPLDAMNAAITAKTLDPRQAGPTQPPMMPTPGVSGPPSAPQVAPQAMPQPQEQPAPANQLFRAAEASKQQDAARAGTLKFKRNGQDYSVSSRDEILAAQKHEKEAQIQDQLGKFDAALAESDDPYLKRNAQTIRAMIRSGEDIRAQDVFSMTAKENAQDEQNRRQADRLAQQLSLETGVKEPGRMERAKIGARSKIQSSSIIANAMKYAADKRGEVAIGAAADRKEGLNEREAKNYLTTTRFQKQVDQGMALGQTLRGLAGGADPEHVLQTRDAQVSLAKFFRGGVPSEGEMGFLYKGIGGLPDKGAQLMRELSSGTLSDLQRQNLENAAHAAKAEHDTLAHETAVGFEKRFRNAKDKQFFRDVAAGYFHPLGLDIPDTFLADAPAAESPAQPAQNPLQKASSAGKSQDKFAAAKVDGRLATLKGALAGEKDPARKARIQQAISAIESGGK